jgi:hypothetical protein
MLENLVIFFPSSPTPVTLAPAAVSKTSDLALLRTPHVWRAKENLFGLLSAYAVLVRELRDEFLIPNYIIKAQERRSQPTPSKRF